MAAKKKRSVKKNISKVKNAVREIETGNEKIVFAFLATFLSIIGFVIALIAKRKDDYVMYYAKHSLIIFIIGAVAGVLGSIVYIIPIIGKIIYTALTIFVVIIWAMSWIYALQGRKKNIAVITKWADKLKI